MLPPLGESILSKSVNLSRKFSRLVHPKPVPGMYQTHNSSWMRAGAGEAPVIALLTRHLNPGIAVLTLYVAALTLGQRFTTSYGFLAILTFVLAGQLMTRPQFEVVSRSMMWRRDLGRVLSEWGCVVVLLTLFGLLFQLAAAYERSVLITWFVITPFALVLVQETARKVATWRRRFGAIRRRLVIVGATKIGCELAARLAREPWIGSVDGFFDDRQPARMPREVRSRLLGRFRDLAEYARRNQVHAIYVCVPIMAQSRIRSLLSDLRDSTASIYIVPDLSAYDLLQARFGEIQGIPLLAVRESPFCGTTGILKRVTDVVLAATALLCVAPLMLLIAIAIRRSSPGPVIFQQRRYGLDSTEFLVYKFRTMTVCEDNAIQQATRDDPRVTPLGRFLRRSSLDELPQLFNVLKGNMSLVGPRPHAVAHNEYYRKLVSGYMVRHKVRPGMTGLAQVNGQRGNTGSLQKMSRRVQFDIEYLNNWSIGLDLRILLKTVLVVLRARRAF